MIDTLISKFEEVKVESIAWYNSIKLIMEFNGYLELAENLLNKGKSADEYLILAEECLKELIQVNLKWINLYNFEIHLATVNIKSLKNKINIELGKESTNYSSIKVMITNLEGCLNKLTKVSDSNTKEIVEDTIEFKESLKDKLINAGFYCFNKERMSVNLQDRTVITTQTLKCY